MNKECIKCLLEDKEKDEAEIGKVISDVIKKYSDKWGNKQIKIVVNAEPMSYLDYQPNHQSITKIFTYSIKSDIIL